MPSVKFSKSDLLASTQLEGNWYPSTVKAVSDWKPGKKDPTSNVIEVDLVIKDGSKAGTPLKHWFSEKSIGTSFDMLPEFLLAFTGKMEDDKEYKLEDTINRKLEVYASWNSEMKMNSISAFRKSKV